MANLVPELNSLDFSVYIGGPLQAAVQAQQAASMAAVKFIQDVGFTTNLAGQTELRYVDFDYKKSTPNPNFGSTDPNLPPTTNTTAPYITTDVSLKVPFLVMLIVPSLRIDTITIDFNARLTSTETSNVTSELGMSAELGINYKIVNFKASASYKRTTSRGEKVEKTYTLGVNVHAVQDELPAGLDRILGLLEDSIVSK
jgi:hypothetical protein